jgi:predicted nucleic acid-binding protein
MREGSAVFVDTGAWIALALNRDPFHERARESWEELLAAGARLFTSVPVVLETFTFLDRNTVRDVAIIWKDSLAKVPRLRILECTVLDMQRAFGYFERRDLHKLSAVDATSFVLMTRSKVHAAFSFDSHFATAGFRLVG